MGGLVRLIYVSTLTEAGRLQGPSLLPDILETSARNNALVGVSGQLLAFGDSFLQVLEGSTPSVDAIFQRVRDDRRHRGVRVLERAEVPAREFGAWAMCGRAISATDDAILKVLSMKHALTLTGLGPREALKLLRSIRAIQARPRAAAA